MTAPDTVRMLRGRSLWRTPLPCRVLDAAFSRRRSELLLLLENAEVWRIDAGGRAEPMFLLDARPRAFAAAPDGERFAACIGEGLTIHDRTGRVLWRRGGPYHSLVYRTGHRLLALRQDYALLALGARGEVRDHVHLPFPAAHVLGGHQEWGAFAVGRWGQLALYGPDLELRWRLELREYAGRPVASDSGDLLLVPVHGEGVYAFGPDGSSPGVYAVPGSPAAVAALPSGERFLVATDGGELYLLTRGHGYCLWKGNARLEEPLALGLTAQRALAVDAAGQATCTELVAKGSRAERVLELREEETAHEREPTWSSPLVARQERFLGTVRVSRDGDHVGVRIRSELRVRGRDGRLVLRGGTDSSAGLLWGQGDRLFTVGPAGVRAIDVRSGEGWSEPLPVRQAAAGEAARSLALIDDVGTVRLLSASGEELWSRDLPEDPQQVLVDSKASAVGVVGIGNTFYLISREGRPLWKRTLERGSRVLLVRKRVLIATPAGELSCYGYRRDRDWRRCTGLAVGTMFRKEGEPFLATVDNRFYRVGATGNITPVDRRTDLGASRIALAAGGEWRELNAHGSLLTCFDLEARIVWRHRFPADVEPWTLSSGGGLLALVAGGTLHAFDLARGRVAAAPGRHRFLELPPDPA